LEKGKATREKEQLDSEPACDDDSVHGVRQPWKYIGKMAGDYQQYGVTAQTVDVRKMLLDRWVHGDLLAETVI
jgi:hypothetical protein